MESSNIIVVPVYKAEISQFEQTSFSRCCKVLYRHNICLVAYSDLDTSCYQQIAGKYQVSLYRENFPKEFFNSIEGYNDLMLSADFYKRFSKYAYILIYQLDAYVFKDELDYWCSKGYDYIGAPFFDNFGSYESGNHLWCVGNGGFSLRKTASFIFCLSLKHPYGSRYLFSKYYDGTIKSLLVVISHILGYKNNYNHFFSNNRYNEDYIFGVCMKKTKYPLLTPDLIESAHFSFDRSPEYLYSMINCLPFGCHQWPKNYNSFWSRYIPNQID